jgi:hypothetical protein
MIDRVVVYYWHRGSWFWSRDYPVSKTEDAKEYGRELWRNGAEGVKITQQKEVVLVEKMRSEGLASGPAPHGPPTPHDKPP